MLLETGPQKDLILFSFHHLLKFDALTNRTELRGVKRRPEQSAPFDSHFGRVSVHDRRGDDYVHHLHFHLILPREHQSRELLELAEPAVRFEGRVVRFHFLAISDLFNI